MKKTLVILALTALVASTSALADGRRGGTINRSNSESAAASFNAGNSQVTVHEAAPIPADTTADIKTVPDVSAPGLTTTMTETCMGSTSAGVAWLGFGVTGGSTWRDGRCANRLDARQLGNFGVQVNDARLVMAGVELLCENGSVQRAAARAGVICGEQDDDSPAVNEVAPQPISDRQARTDSQLPNWFVANE